MQQKIVRIFAIVLLACVTVGGLFAATIHVPSEAPTIQDAINIAVSDDTIVLADGTYQGTNNRDCNNMHKSLTVTSENGAEATVIDCGGSAAEQHYSFDLHGLGSTAFQFTGLTIRNAYWSLGAIRGVGLVLTVDHCRITGNTSTGSGGGINCASSELRLTQTEISLNNAANDGGGVATDGPFTIYQCVFSENQTQASGGAIASPSFHNAWTISSSVFSDNSGSNGGAMYLNSINGAIANCQIINNHATALGGGLHSSSGGPKIAGCTFNGNSADGGGGIFCTTATPWVTNTIFIGNQANSGAAVEATDQSYPPFSNCGFFANEAINQGGGIYCTAGATVAISNCTFVGNQAGAYGGGILIEAPGSQATVTNSILFGDHSTQNLGPEIAMLTNAALITFCSDVAGGESLVYADPGCSLTWDAGNLDLDPQFVTGPGGGYYLSQIAAGQATDSPCVDAGCTVARVSCYETLFLLDDSIVARDTCLDKLGTRTDQVHDSGPADLGYHHADVVTPTPDPNATPTPTQIPSTATPTLAPTQSPTPSNDLGIALALTQDAFHPGDLFVLTMAFFNSTVEVIPHQAYVLLLEAYGSYFWYPTWSSDLHISYLDLDQGIVTQIPLAFIWPAGAGAGSGACFYGAMLTQDLTAILGSWDSACFGWAEN